MTLNNKTIIEKADVTLATLASGGLMNPEQADTFLRMVQNSPTILKDSRFVQMASDTLKIEKSALVPVFFAPVLKVYL